MGRIIFVTGTDTAVGKTYFTCLCLRQLRQNGIHALGMKPFCSGSLDDVRRIQACQPSELTDKEVNPYYFPQPIAPWLALEKSKKIIRRGEVLKKIKQVAKKCDLLLVEGSGGLMVPLLKNFLVLDLIHDLKSPAVLVARNKLGTINHTLLSIKALDSIGLKGSPVILLGQKTSDLSSQSNFRALTQLLPGNKVLEIGYKEKPQPGSLLAFLLPAHHGSTKRT